MRGNDCNNNKNVFIVDYFLFCFGGGGGRGLWGRVREGGGRGGGGGGGGCPLHQFTIKPVCDVTGI